MLPAVPAEEATSAISSAVAPKFTISKIRTATRTAGHLVRRYIFAANGQRRMCPDQGVCMVQLCCTGLFGSAL
jgi:hypothetical protein